MESSPTYLIAAGRPVFVSDRRFRQLLKGAYPENHLIVGVHARMVSELGGRNYPVNKARRAIWKHVTQWLRQEFAKDPEQAEREWLPVDFDDAEARTELRDLLVAWADWNKKYEAIGMDGAEGVTLRTRRLFRRPACAEVLLLTGHVTSIRGSLESFTVSTKNEARVLFDKMGVRSITT